jgi:lipid II:glycine glycyltransferase (peptidoglycan interpeptide bridge formation enzyme)
MGQRPGQTRPDAPTAVDLSDFQEPGGDHSDVVVSVEPDPDAATRHRWDQLVATTPRSDVAQLSGWAQVRQQAGFAPTYLLARANDQLMGGALLLHRQLPIGPVGYLPYGPILPTGELRAQTTEALCSALTDFARHRLAAFFVQPMAGAEDVPQRLLRFGFRPSPPGVAPPASIAIDLNRPTDDLRASMRSGTRDSIKRATSQGVKVRQGSEDDLPAVAELLAGMTQHHNCASPSLPYLRVLYRELNAGNHISIVIAERDGAPLAADLLTASGGMLRLRFTGMRRSVDARKTGAAALLRWQTILWAKANAYHTLDLGAIPPSAVDRIHAEHTHLAAHIDGRGNYKASFGGRPFHYPPLVELLPLTPARIGHDLSHRSALGTRLTTIAENLLRKPGPR